jgi:hypothetical protein
MSRYDQVFNGGQSTPFKLRPSRVNKYRECMEIVRASEYDPKFTTKILEKAIEA